jgi:hypothetical protein
MINKRKQNLRSVNPTQCSTINKLHEGQPTNAFELISNLPLLIKTGIQSSLTTKTKDFQILQDKYSYFIEHRPWSAVAFMLKTSEGKFSLQKCAHLEFRFKPPS